jgi:predicted Zn-dependent peptidase
MKFQVHQFENGIRLVHQPSDSLVAHFAFMVLTGSRDEEEEEHGMAHFFEHVIFKGTKKRKNYHIISRLEDVGGEINAYTTKEETCIHSSFLKVDYKRAIDLIFDICFNSVFPEKEITKEKSVILDEILSYQDNPSELIFDDFEEQVYHGLPIGRNILGTQEHLAKFDRSSIMKFIGNNYSTSEMVICSVGDINFARLVNICKPFFGSVPAKNRVNLRIPPNGYIPQFKSLEKNTYQNHCMVGNIAYKVSDDRRLGLLLLSNILGGPGMNSRLNMSLRERNGYAYDVESHYSPYSDTGIFMVYFGCDKGKFDKSLNLVYKEFENLRKNALGSLQLSKAKKQILGQVAIMSESNEAMMLSLGKTLLMLDRIDSLEEIRQKIEAVTALQILEIANDILDPAKLSVLKYS